MTSQDPRTNRRDTTRRARARQPSPRRWDDIRLVLEIARLGSFNQAARELGVSQSTVSRRLAALEQAFGREIFDREPAMIGYPPRELTELGERLFRRAEQVEAAIWAFNNEPRRRPADLQPCDSARGERLCSMTTLWY